MNSFFDELKKRNVYKVATAYAVTSWLVIQVVNTVGPNLSWPDSVASSITKILLVGFPIALVLTWLYEFTPHGLKRTGAIQENTSDNRRAGRRLNRVIIGALALVICVMLVERVFSGNTSINEKQKASIAVLPFVNISSDGENENFADALTLSIHDQLTKLSGMDIVIAPISSFVFKGKDNDIRDVAQDLGVNYILEGSLQYDRRSNKIEIRTLLRNGNNGYTLDSKSYKYNYEDSFGIQEDVSRKVASELRIQILPEEDKALSLKPSDNQEAYRLYSESRKFSSKRNDTDLEKGMELLKQALDLDPNFAEAHAELSFLYGQRHFYGNLSKEVMDEMMDFHLSKAKSIAPNKPEVLRAEATYHLKYRIDSSKAIANLRKAIDLKPNYADAHYALFMALSWAGQRKFGIKSLEKTVELDPISFYASQLASIYYMNYNDHKKALGILDNIIKNDPSGGGALPKALIIAREPYGDLVEAFKLVHQHNRISAKNPKSFSLSYEGNMALNLDLMPISEKCFRIMEMRYPDSPGTFYNLATLYSIKEQFTLWEELVNFWVAEKDLDPIDEAWERIWLKYSRGNYEMALQLYEETFPELSTSQIYADSLSLEKAKNLVPYTDLLKINGNHKKANYISREVCRYYNSIIATDSMIPPYEASNYQLQCYYISNDIPAFLEKLEEHYFVKKNRLAVFANIKLEAWALFEDNPDYQALVKRITEDIHRQRAEVITYLKEEGDWDPAWDKELGLE